MVNEMSQKLFLYWEGQKIKEYAKKNKGFCLLFDESTNELRLDTNHEYYSQVQLQLFVTELSLALFVVFNGNKDIEYVTVQRNEDVIAMMVSKDKLYFVYFILPELVAKRYTSVKAVPQTSTSRQQNALSDKLNQFICYCQDPVKNEETVMCASTFCVIYEFHKTCTGSKRITESWLGTFCKKETAARKRKSGRNNQLVGANSVELVEPNREATSNAGTHIMNGKRTVYILAGRRIGKIAVLLFPTLLLLLWLSPVPIGLGMIAGTTTGMIIAFARESVASTARMMAAQAPNLVHFSINVDLFIHCRNKFFTERDNDGLV
ncbi:Uncharacterized protein APZ42_030085 [Daphnia magna]|uniref:Uncharacterized protein n=1 Tax=Daphnia magna TaxID=35525 RepID=A0A164P2T7_9CRUS|nr:Uncharacterized protein APZ42_030085 [Daphnia magna]